MAEVRRCGYVPSSLAQSLRKNKTNTIGLVLPSISNPYFADIASAVIAGARERGYTTIIVDSMENRRGGRMSRKNSLPKTVASPKNGKMVARLLYEFR